MEIGMKIIGLVGGIGSGKSTVAEIFAKKGAVVIDADRLGHEVLRLSEIKSAMKKQWGDDIFDDHGEVDRRKMAKIVFSGDETGDTQLAALKTLVHPKIGDLIRQKIAEAEAENTKLVLIDAPLLLEGSWDSFCEEILFIDVSEEVRMDRAMKRGWSREEYFVREANQFSLETKKSAATFIINNNGDIRELEKQVCRFMKSSHL